MSNEARPVYCPCVVACAKCGHPNCVRENVMGAVAILRGTLRGMAPLNPARPNVEGALRLLTSGDSSE